MRKLKGRELEEELELKKALDIGPSEDDYIGEDECPACHRGIFVRRCGWCSEHQRYRCEEGCACDPRPESL